MQLRQLVRDSLKNPKQMRIIQSDSEFYNKYEPSNMLSEYVVSLFPIDFEAWQIRILSQLEKEKQQQNSRKGNT